MPESSGTRKPKTLTVVLIVIGVLVACLVAVGLGGLALFVPARQEITEVPEPAESPEPPAGQSAEVADDSIESEAEAVAGLVMTSSASWAAHITGVEVVTVLRRPVIVVSTDIGSEQADLSDSVASGLASFAGGLVAQNGVPYSYYFQVLSSEGDLIGTAGSTDERWQLETPPAPTEPASLQAWLEDMYGSGAPMPEPWIKRITGLGSDSDGLIVVRTDLDPALPADQRAAQTIIDAVNSSGADFAPGIRVIFRDGAFEWSSLLDGRDPYGG